MRLNRNYNSRHITVMICILGIVFLDNNISGAEPMRKTDSKIKIEIQPLTFNEPISPSYKKILIDQKALEKAQRENGRLPFSLDNPILKEESIEKGREDLDVVDYSSIEEKIKEAQEKNNKDNYLLASEICQNIKENLSRYSILVVDGEANIVVEVSVSKTGIDSLYGPRLIADTVIYKGLMNNKTVFSGEFKQNYKGWFSLTSIKTPGQIGKILANKIVKELKNL